MMIRPRILFFRVARILAMFFVVAIIAGIIAISRLDLDSMRDDISSMLQNSTGMPVHVDGKISWRFSLRPVIILENIRVPNADWATEKNGFTASRIRASLDLISLIRGRTALRSLRVYDIDVNIEKNDKGEYSLSPAGQGITENHNVNKFPLDLNLGIASLEVRNANINYLGNDYVIEGFRAEFDEKKDAIEISGWVKTGEKIFPYIIKFSEYVKERKIYPVRIAVSTGGDALVANLALEGTSKMPIDFIVKGTIMDVSGIASLLGLEIINLPRVDVNIAGGLGNKKITFRKSSISALGVNMDIYGDFDWSGKNPVISAKIYADKINLLNIYPGLYIGTPWVRPNRELNVFKDVSLFGKELKDYNLDLQLKFDELVVYRDIAIKNSDISLTLKDSEVKAKAKAGFASGELTAALEANIDDNGVIRARGAGRGKKVVMGEIMTMIREKDFLSDLPANFEFYLRGHGATLAQLMSTITGPLRIYSTSKGYAYSGLVTYVYGTDFLTSLRHNIQDLFSSDKKTDQLTLDCAVINLKLRNGVVETERGIALETNAINMRVAGNVDFGKETIKAALITVPVRGLKLSITGNVVNNMEITGNMAEPSISVNGTALAAKAVSATGIGLLLAPFTGGLSIAAGAGLGFLAGDLLENWLSDPHPCKTALEEGAPEKKGDPEFLNKNLDTLVNEMLG